MSHVFVIDDETSVRELLYEALTHKGHQVTTVGSGTQVLEMLKADRPQLILLDSNMPGLSGLETAKQIRAFDDSVPIVLLRAADESEVPAEELERVGISETVRKDADKELFINSVEVVLKRFQSKPAATAGESGMKVPGCLLVVDDNSQMLRLLRTFFTARGMRVLLANSGEEALKAVTQNPTAMLLDVNMPGMDGLMTLKKIKETHPKLPVIMISGVGEDATVREALKAGAYDYITKPFSLEYLETVVLTKILLGIEG